MIDTVVVQPTTTDGDPPVAGASWAAVTAGAVVSCALTLLLLAFGVGLGLSVVSPWSKVTGKAQYGADVPAVIRTSKVNEQ